MLNFRKRSFWQSLVAVLAGNAIYFSVERFLPPRAQHELYQIDWGLAVDFWVCLVCYGLVRVIRSKLLGAVGCRIRMTVSFMKKAIVLVLLASAAWAETPATISLPKPNTTGGMPLMQALNARQSGREFSPEKLSPQALSNLLWAAYGVNRPDGRRTAPSANNRQTIDIYAVLAEAVYLYNAKEHRLDLVVPGDLRKATGSPQIVAHAPLNPVPI